MASTQVLKLLKAPAKYALVAVFACFWQAATSFPSAGSPTPTCANARRHAPTATTARQANATAIRTMGR